MSEYTDTPMFVSTVCLTFHSNTQVVNKTCIGIGDVNPNQICLGSTDSITLLGRGFTNDLNQSAVTCRFQTDNGHSLGRCNFCYYIFCHSPVCFSYLHVVTYPTEAVMYNQVVCPAPQLNRTG